MINNHGSTTTYSEDKLAKFRCSLDPEKLRLASPEAREAIITYAGMIAEYRARLSDIDAAIAISPDGPGKRRLIDESDSIREAARLLYFSVQPYQTY
ncbi:MAG: hypothetical protein EOS10_11725 [Mesorhizobium sp.]|uniref:hypothetical protein n=1 Tax=Mesorhizobium sp. TaxID=1871066 RepID=UPI000FE8F4DB|nr:hypothetical protein [Mesorhizobium sp.]RWO32358.1 MAG: hypothetical protein EOS10_11725 [Mesorhizobium sp.]